MVSLPALSTTAGSNHDVALRQAQGDREGDKKTVMVSASFASSRTILRPFDRLTAQDDK